VSSIFISAYLDEDVSVLIAELLRSRGFAAVTALDSGQLHKTDAEQLSYATDHGLTLLTHNRTHFEELAKQYFETGRSHCGIIIAVRRLPHEILRRLLVILNEISADEMENRVVYI
jgi:hypothetical protein